MKTRNQWRTKGGVLVEERARSTVKVQHYLRGEPKLLESVVKIKAFRVATGGFHGWLRLDRLKPVRQRKRAHAA